MISDMQKCKNGTSDTNNEHYAKVEGNYFPIE